MVDFATIRETTVPQLDTLTDDEAEAIRAYVVSRAHASIATPQR